MEALPEFTTRRVMREPEVIRRECLQDISLFKEGGLRGNNALEFTDWSQAWIGLDSLDSACQLFYLVTLDLFPYVSA